MSETLPESAWHRHHLSGGSSQVLAVALLAAAKEADPSLGWLPASEGIGASPLTLFEVEIAPHVLNEQPRQTSIDWLVVDSDRVVAAEAKFTERGFGVCSCDSAPQCSPRVLERPYWETAERELGVRRREQASHCGLSLVYQAVRNIAAAAAIAGPEREASFALLYDERNPYFTGAGTWPGWVPMLEGLTRYSRVAFSPLSWQQLLTRSRLDVGVARWAHEKHGISDCG